MASRTYNSHSTCARNITLHTHSNSSANFASNPVKHALASKSVVISSPSNQDLLQKRVEILKLRTSFMSNVIQNKNHLMLNDHHIFSKKISLAIESQHVEFKSRKTVSIECVELDISVEEYLADTQRIVNVAFPDSKRLKYLENKTWRARLKPVSFFTLSATPVCNMRAWFESNELRIFSDDVVLTLDGLPSQFHDVQLHLHLEGKLFANRSHATTTTMKTVKRNIKTSNYPCTLDGWVDLKLKLELPMPFSFFPSEAVSSVGNSILNNILSAMQQALLNHLVKDYYVWNQERVLLQSRQLGLLSQSTVE